MRVLEHSLASLMRDEQRLRDYLQDTLAQRGFQQAHLEAMQQRLAMLLTAQQPPEAERS